MKRFYVAVLLLIFTLSICGAEFIYINSCADNISEKIEKIYKAYSDGNKDRAMRYAIETEEDWEKRVNKIDMLLYHDYVDDITKNIVNLKTYIHEDDAVGLYSTMGEALAQIKSLKKSEFPTMDNII